MSPSFGLCCSDELDLTCSQARHISKRVVNPSAWTGNSANFAITEFYEVRDSREARSGERPCFSGREAARQVEPAQVRLEVEV